MAAEWVECSYFYKTSVTDGFDLSNTSEKHFKVQSDDKLFFLLTPDQSGHSLGTKDKKKKWNGLIKVLFVKISFI